MEMLLEHGAAVEFEQRLQKQLGGRVRNLRVQRRNGQLILSGSSHSFYVKQLATHAILELGPTEELVNEIVVDPRC